jgi:hypothetical protein
MLTREQCLAHTLESINSYYNQHHFEIGKVSCLDGHMMQETFHPFIQGVDYHSSKDRAYETFAQLSKCCTFCPIHYDPLPKFSRNR